METRSGDLPLREAVAVGKPREVWCAGRSSSEPLRARRWWLAELAELGRLATGNWRLVDDVGFTSHTPGARVRGAWKYIHII